LPTSLTYIVLSARGCSPRRPAADMGTIWRENFLSNSPSNFQGPTRAHRTPREPRCFWVTTSLSPARPIPGSPSLTKKRQLFPGLSLTSSSRFALPHLFRKRRRNAAETISTSRFGNINPIPFQLKGSFKLITMLRFERISLQL
jgi:hypothetical protein